MRVSGFRKNFFAIVTVCFVGVTQAKAAVSTQALNQWAKSELQRTFLECENLSRTEVLKKLKLLEQKYEDQLEEVPLKQLIAMKLGSAFTEVGEVVFPKQLPNRYPYKNIFLICDEAHQDFLLSVNTEDRKDKLDLLKSCLTFAYRKNIPATAKMMLDCYSKL